MKLQPSQSWEQECSNLWPWQLLKQRWMCSSANAHATRHSDKANEELRNRIAEQKLVMEDVMDLVSSYEQSPGLAEVINTLQPVVAAFDAVQKEEASSDISKSGGAIVIGGGTRYTASEEVLAQITDAVSTARNQLVK